MEKTMDNLGIDLRARLGLFPLISKLLGYFLVAASMTVKLTQLVATSYFTRPLSVSTWVREVVYFALAPILFTGQIGPSVFEALYASKYLILLSSKVPQIWKNFRNKSTGQLSFLTCLMNFGGAMARVFTSVQEEDAPFSMAMGIVLAVSMHGIIMIQILFYRSKGGEEEKQLDDKKMS